MRRATTKTQLEPLAQARSTVTEGTLSIGVPTEPPLSRSGAVSVEAVDNRNEIRDFLVSRRARVIPGQAGLPAYGHDRRRVAGLRREEVALLAGVSIDYYTKLERGQLRGVSESVLEALASALQLDDAERAHLYDLSRTATAAAPRTRRPATGAGGAAERSNTLDAITGAPADVRNARRDVLAANKLGRALYSEMYADPPAEPANIARFVFLSARARTFFLDWSRAADDTVATLRTEAGGTLRQGPVRPDRRAGHAKRRVQHPMGFAQRPIPPLRL